MRKIKGIYLVILTILLSPTIANAGLIEYDWTWTGTSGYTAMGVMSYDDSLANTGVITASSISSLTIEAFQGTTSLFTWDLATGTQSNPFQLTFNTTGQNIVTGGFYPTALDSVVWGDDGFGSSTAAGGALICGTGACGIIAAGAGFRGSRNVSETTQFSFIQSIQKASPVPEPGTLALMGLGVLGMTRLRRKGK